MSSIFRPSVLVFIGCLLSGLVSCSTSDDTEASDPSTDWSALDSIANLADMSYTGEVVNTMEDGFTIGAYLSDSFRAPRKNNDGYLPLSWEHLSDVVFHNTYVPKLDAYFWKPVYGPFIKRVETQKVFVSGYLIPFSTDAEGDVYVLSKFPEANCFFCQKAGPETIVALKLKKKGSRKWFTDMHMSFKGKLRLNTNDYFELNYILEDAEPYFP